MIFQPALVRLILEGRKTQTRRVHRGERECRYKPGGCYAIQPGRGKAGVGKLTVTAVRVEELGAISEADAHREGFPNRREFRRYWQALHDSYDAEALVWVIAFRAGDHRDHPRLLVARSGTSEGDYTAVPARAMRHEAEAVSEDEQGVYVLDGRRNDTALQRRRWAERRERLLELVRETRAELPPGVRDDELRGIERQVLALDRRVESVLEARGRVDALGEQRVR